jgi:DNA-directed RNA polymerase specialized sigma24 family protein
VFAAPMAAEPADTRDRLGRLPERHLAALRAVLAGFADADIAGLLGIPVEAVPTTVRLAVAKLVTALADRGPAIPPQEPGAPDREPIGEVPPRNQ